MSPAGQAGDRCSCVFGVPVREVAPGDSVMTLMAPLRLLQARVPLMVKAKSRGEYGNV